jgi:hypothetical protein
METQKVEVQPSKFTPMAASSLVALSLVGAAVAAPSSFSCAVSTVTLVAGKPALTVCDHTVAPGNSGGAVAQMWMTGTGVNAPNEIDDVLIEIFIDGETSASVSLFPYQVHCVGLNGKVFHVLPLLTSECTQRESRRAPFDLLLLR